MRKKTKGLLAGGLGLALLLGTGGTFAMWYQEREVEGGAIETGRMDMTVDLEWVDGTFDDDAEEILWVPGDWAFAELEVNVTLEGTNLEAALSIDGIEIAVPEFAPANEDDDGNGDDDDNGDEPFPLRFFLTGGDLEAPIELAVGESIPIDVLTDTGPVEFQLWAGFPSFMDGFASDSSVAEVHPFGALVDRDAFGATPATPGMWGALGMGVALDLSAINLTLVQVPSAAAHLATD